MFEPFDSIIDWDGHCDKPEAEESVYHVDRDGKIDIRRNDQCQYNGYSFSARYSFDAVMDDSAKRLANAVNDCKRRFAGKRGGSFYINEYGVVIVPCSEGWNDVEYKAIGRWTGELWFINHTPHEYFSLADDRGLAPGDAWPYPYLGMKYYLTPEECFSYVLESDSGNSHPQLPDGNDKIKRNLRSIRGYNFAYGGYISFVINNHGIVLTRRATRGDNSPVYVGRIDLKEWYPDPMSTADFGVWDISDTIARLNGLYPKPPARDFEIFMEIKREYWKGGHRNELSIGMKQALFSLADRYLK